MSPFRATSAATRTRAALTISLDNIDEIRAMKARLQAETDPVHKRALRTRLRALEAHQQGWADYVGRECPRVKNATEKPKRSTR